jgi:hypothetical protein
MSAVNVTIIGTITPIGAGAAAGEGGPCIIQGQLNLSDLGIWGGKPPPYVDIAPPYPQAPGVPTHPIVIPPPPTDPPENPEQPKPPPPDGGWGWHPQYGWGYFPGGGGKPQPPASSAGPTPTKK